MKSDRIYDQAHAILPGVCFECEAPAEHRHHVVPASRGGTRVVWLCEPCHEKTHGYDQGVYAMMREGRKEVIKNGGYGGGRRYYRRYGVELTYVMGKLCYRPIPVEQGVIKRICEEHAGGSGYGSIARRLNDEGVRTVTGVRWSKKTVRDITLRGPDKLSPGNPG